MFDLHRAAALVDFIISLEPTDFYYCWFKDSIKYIVALGYGDFTRYEYQLYHWHYKLVDNVYRQLTGL